MSFFKGGIIFTGMLWGLAHYFKSLEDETRNVNEKYQVSATLMKLSSPLLRAVFESKIGKETCLSAKARCYRPKHDDLGAIFSFTFLIPLLTGNEHHLELYYNISTPSWTSSRQSCPRPRATCEVLSDNSNGLDGGRERVEQTNQGLLFVLRRLCHPSTWPLRISLDGVNWRLWWRQQRGNLCLELPAAVSY